MVFLGNKATAAGTAAAALVALGAFGAGATPRHGPPLPGTLLHGTGHALAVAILYLGVAGLLLSWVYLGRSVRAGGSSARDVTRTAWLWCLPLLVAPPLFSTDLYTYLAQGAVAQAGLDPYTHVPAEVSGPISDNASGGWLYIASPYGPLHILIVKSVLALTGSSPVPSVVLTRLVITAGLALLCLALPVLCRHLGTNTENALWLTVANPFVVLCVVAGGHNDLLMVGLLAAGTALGLSAAPVRGFALVALAAAVKAPAALVLPFLVWVWAAQRQDTRARNHIFVLGMAVSIVVTTFGLCSLISGVDLGWLRALSGNAWLEPWLSIPTALGKIAGFVAPGAGHAMAMCRAAGLLVLAGLLSWLWWRAREGGPVAVRAAAAALLAAVVLTPVALPWYFVWPLVLGAAAFSWPTSRVAIVSALSTWLVLSGFPDGQTKLPPWAYVVAAGVAAGVGFLTAGRARARSHSGEPHESLMAQRPLGVAAGSSAADDER